MDDSETVRRGHKDQTRDVSTGAVCNKTLVYVLHFKADRKLCVPVQYTNRLYLSYCTEKGKGLVLLVDGWCAGPYVSHREVQAE